MKLYDPMFRYDHINPMDFLAHILKHYAVINDDVLEDNTKQFNEPPAMSLPINVYFRNQERCRQLATNGNVPISKTDMVLKLQIHMGKSGMVNGAYTKWKQKASVDQKWAPGKSFFCLAIKEASNITKLSGKNDFSANTIDKLQDTVGS